MLHLSKTSQATNRGFTLVETIVVVSLTVLVGGALATMIQYFYRTNSYAIQEGTATQNARLGLSTAIQDLREASYGDDGSYPIASASPTSVVFYADVNGDGSVDQVTYLFSNGSLSEGVTHSAGSPPTYVGQVTSTTTVAAYLRNTGASPVFQYYDNTGALLASPVNLSQVASVAVTLIIDVDPNRSPTPYTLTGSATLRNLEN